MAKPTGQQGSVTWPPVPPSELAGAPSESAEPKFLERLSPVGSVGDTIPDLASGATAPGTAAMPTGGAPSVTAETLFGDLDNTPPPGATPTAVPFDSSVTSPGEEPAARPSSSSPVADESAAPSSGSAGSVAQSSPPATVAGSSSLLPGPDPSAIASGAGLQGSPAKPTLMPAAAAQPAGPPPQSESGLVDGKDLAGASFGAEPTEADAADTKVTLSGPETTETDPADTRTALSKPEPATEEQPPPSSGADPTLGKTAANGEAEGLEPLTLAAPPQIEPQRESLPGDGTPSLADEVTDTEMQPPPGPDFGTPLPDRMPDITTAEYDSAAVAAAAEIASAEPATVAVAAEIESASAPSESEPPAEEPSEAAVVAQLGMAIERRATIKMDPQKLTRRRSLPGGAGIALGAGGVLVLVGVLVLLFTPWLGWQLADPLGLGGVVEKAPQEEVSDPSPTPTTDEVQARPPAMVLSRDTVDQLDYADLRRAVQPGVSSDVPEAVWAWARYRLAARFQDGAVQQSLIQNLARPNEIPKLEPLAAAAQLGALVLSGKAGPARKVGERMLKGPAGEDPHLALVMSTTYRKKSEQAKALSLLERALKQQPQMPDAVLARAELLLEKGDPLPTEPLVALAEQQPAGDVALQVTELLWRAGRFDLLFAVATTWPTEAGLDRVAPAHQDQALALLCRQQIRNGDLEGAMTIAQDRAGRKPARPAALVELAQLQSAVGQDPTDAIQKAIAAAPENEEQRALKAEAVRLALRQGGATRAQAVLDQHRAELSRKGGAYLKLAEGWIARAQGKADSARAAFSAAAKARPKPLWAQVEQALLSAKTPTARLKRLRELNKKATGPLLQYELARAQAEVGNPGAAYRTLDRWLWTSPTQVDPREALLLWAQLVAQTGRVEQATTLAKNLRADPSQLTPSRSLPLAKALIDAGEVGAAEQILSEMFTTYPDSKTPLAMVQMARAQHARDAAAAEQLLEAALAQKKMAKGFLVRAEWRRAAGQAEAARADLDRALELSPASPEVLVEVARRFRVQKELDLAKQQLDLVLSKDPTFVPALHLYGELAMVQGKVREATKKYKRALKNAGDNVAILSGLAQLQLLQKDQVPAAIKTLRKVNQLDPSDPEATCRLGLALKEKSGLAKARLFLEMCVGLDAGGELGRSAQKMLQSGE